MSQAAVVPLLCSFLVFVILWRIFLSRKRAMKLPPMAEGALPIVGHTFLLLANRKRLFELTSTMLGASMKKGHEAVTVRCGTWDVYVVMNPDDGNLLASSCLKKDMIYKFFKPWFGDEGLVTADVPIWKRHRKLLKPTFNQSILDTYLTEFNGQSRQLVNDLAQEAGKGAFDQMPFVKNTILQVVCATIMGVSVGEDELKNKLSKANEIFTDCMVERIRKFWYHNDFLFSFSNLKKKQDTAAATLHELSYKVLRMKKAQLIRNDKANESEDLSKPRFKSFLDLLLELSEEGALTESEVREEMETFIGAGSDTTSHGLGITLLIIGSYPRVQQKVFDELHEVLGGTGRDVERQDLSKLKYLEAVIKETMRLYPVIVGVGRTLDTDLNFKNCTVPADSSCYLSIYNIGRHPVWGADAEQFRPERWLDGSLPTNTRAYAVFGLGKRSCIGSNFAMMTMKTILAHVLRRYHVSGDVTQLVQSMDIVARLMSGYHISIERREEPKVKAVSKGN